jgi:uncharacterized protein with von Willebrand factor type A (vWA) domain
VLRVLDELLWALRRDGFPVSTAQALDVVRVVALVGFEDRAVLRDAIGAVVVERRADRERFRSAFDGFFAAERAHAGDLWSRLRARGFVDAELAALRELLDAAAQHSGAGSEGLALQAVAGAESELDHLLRAAGIERALAPMTSSLQAGFFAQRLMDQLAVPQAASALRRIAGALKEALGDARGTALAAALAEELDRVRRRVRMHVDRKLAERLAPPERKGSRAESTAFAGLTEGERAEVRVAVRRLGERLRGAERVRRKRARAGAIDVRRTLRASLRTAGVPFAPARKKRRRDKAQLVIACDVSDSVRAASLFMLELVHVAHELFARTRSFVFVSELAETTALLDDIPVEAALARVYGGHVVNLAHNSNYGRALGALEIAVGREIDRRTTLVILGDGRTNYMADGAEALARLRARARTVLWICPEPAGTWGTGDSAMLRFAGAVTRVLVARTAGELEIAARAVAARR